MKINIIHLPETESTNTYAVQLLSMERPNEGSVVVTDRQTQGKGTDANVWESEDGKNLTFSLILYPGFPADQRPVTDAHRGKYLRRRLAQDLYLRTYPV